MGGPQAKAAETPVLASGGAADKAAETPVPASGGAADKAAGPSARDLQKDAIGFFFPHVCTPAGLDAAFAPNAPSAPAPADEPQPKAADPDEDTAFDNVPRLQRYALIRSIGTVSGPPMKFRNPRAAPGPGRLKTQDLKK